MTYISLFDVANELGEGWSSRDHGHPQLPKVELEQSTHSVRVQHPPKVYIDTCMKVSIVYNEVRAVNKKSTTYTVQYPRLLTI